jgi:hypothetical protein
MRTEIRFLGLLLSVIVVCPSAGQEPRLVNTLENSRSEVSSFLKSLGAVGAPDRAEALPVKLVGAGLSAESFVEEQPVVLASKVGAKLAGALLSVDSYAEGMSACLFNPAVAFRFHQGGKAVQALVCFQCNELVFEEPGGRALSGKMRLSKGRSILLATAKLAFPKNRELQELKQ